MSFFQLRQEYKESDFKQYWMPDDHCKECYECGEKFNTFRRRHHCRLCGQIFCYRCCYLEIPGVIMGYNGKKKFIESWFNVYLMKEWSKVKQKPKFKFWLGKQWMKTYFVEVTHPNSIYGIMYQWSFKFYIW